MLHHKLYKHRRPVTMTTDSLTYTINWHFMQHALERETQPIWIKVPRSRLRACLTRALAASNRISAAVTSREICGWNQAALWVIDSHMTPHCFPSDKKHSLVMISRWNLDRKHKESMVVAMSIRIPLLSISEPVDTTSKWCCSYWWLNIDESMKYERCVWSSDESSDERVSYNDYVIANMKRINLFKHMQQQ